MTAAVTPDPAAPSQPEAGAEERTQQLITAAYSLLDTAGLEGLTIRAVLAKTGLSRRAFYERFESKDDLVLAVFEHTIRLAAQLYDERSARMADPLERLRWIVTAIVLGRGVLDLNVTSPDNRRGAALSREHLRLAESRPKELEVALAPLIAVIVRHLKDGIAEGLIRPCDPHLQAVLIYNLVSTTMHTELLATETVRPERAKRLQLAVDLWEFCRRAIVA